MAAWSQLIEPLYSVIAILSVIATILTVLYILFLATFLIRRLISDLPMPEIITKLRFHQVIWIIIGVLYGASVLFFAAFFLPLILLFFIAYFVLKFGFPILLKRRF